VAWRRLRHQPAGLYVEEAVGRKPGNEPVVDEYLRRQAMSAGDYGAFIAGLKKKFPAQPFLIVRYGDHQPEFSPRVLDPPRRSRCRQEAGEIRPALYATYYAIDAINFEPVQSPAVMDAIDGAYLPLVIQEAAGIPLDPSFESRRASCCAARRVLCLQGRCGKRGASTGC